MLISMLLDLIDQHIAPSHYRIRKVYVAIPNGTLHEVIGAEKTLGGDLVLVVEPPDTQTVNPN